jgi:hypothetical protein
MVIQWYRGYIPELIPSMNEQLIIKSFYQWAGWNAPLEALAFNAIRSEPVLEKLREIHSIPISYTEAAERLILEHLDDELLSPVIAYIFLEGGYHNQYRSIHGEDDNCELGQDILYPTPSSPFSYMIYAIGLALGNAEFPEGDPEYSTDNVRRYMLYLPKWCKTIQLLAIFKYISMPCRHWLLNQYIAPQYERDPEVHLNSIQYLSIDNASTWADLVSTTLMNSLDDYSTDGLLRRHNAIVWQHAVNMSFKRDANSRQSILQMEYAALALLQAVMVAKLAAAKRSEQLFPTSTPFTHVSLYDGRWMPFDGEFYSPTPSNKKPQSFIFIPHQYVGNTNSTDTISVSPIPLLGDGILISYVTMIDRALLHESSFGLIDCDDINNWANRMVTWLNQHVHYPYNPRIADLASYLVRPINVDHPLMSSTVLPGGRYVYQQGVRKLESNSSLPLTTPYMIGTVTAAEWRRISLENTTNPEYSPELISGNSYDLDNQIAGAFETDWPSVGQAFRKGIYAYVPKTTLMPMVVDLALLFPEFFSQTSETHHCMEALTARHS